MRTVTSDASGSFGCGAFSLENGWFQLEWPESWNRVHIVAKELVPIVIAAALWGPHWHGSCIMFRTDNMAVVEVLRSHSARDPLLMHLLRCLVFYASVHHFDILGEHIAGVHNAAADAISRNNLALFSSMFPQVPHIPIPQSVQDLLVKIQPDWGSHTCSRVLGPGHRQVNSCSLPTRLAAVQPILQRTQSTPPPPPPTPRAHSVPVRSSDGPDSLMGNHSR